MALALHDVLAEICSAASVGRVVPFAGAGVSHPLCRGWEPFITALSNRIGHPPAAFVAEPGQDSLYRLADRAAFALRLMREDEQRGIIRDALLDPSAGQNIPAQAIALARGRWPLVMTTNYDDVFLAALQAVRPFQPLQRRERTRLLGRSQADCTDLVRSLDTNQPPLIWHIQGFAGRVVPDGVERIEVDVAARELLDQVVIGHQQYQIAANRNPAFRRAFSEVYRRRSLLFVGSGLAESYFVNLISEVMLNYGPSPRSHFALFCDEELGALDTEFLELRLGVTPVRYGTTFADLPHALEKISEATRYGPSLTAARPLSVSYAVPRGNGDASPRSLEFAIRFSSLELPRAKECVVLSVGLERTANGLEPLIGPMVKSYFREHDLDRLGQSGEQYIEFLWHEISNGLGLFRLGPKEEPQSLFLLGAHDMVNVRTEARKLSEIEQATFEALKAIEQLGTFNAVSMGLIGTGDRAFAHPAYCFIAQLGGVRKFANSEVGPVEQPIQVVELRVVDPEVIAPVIEGRISPQELISSDRIRVFVRVSDVTAHAEAFTINVAANDTVADALKRYRILDEGVTVGASPLPDGAVSDPRASPVFPTMTIDVRPYGL